MSGKYNNFQSQSQLDFQKEENRKARQLVLEQAKRSYERSEAKKEKARKQGEGTWMLDSVSQRINKEEKAIKKAKKKKKKHKKEKKGKKRHSSTSSSSASDDEDNEKWVEHTTLARSAGTSTVKGPQLQRESWMEAPIDLVPTTTRQELRDAINKEKEEAKLEAEKMSQPGQHARELNPYWKDGGTGLPEEKKEKSSLSLTPSVSGAGDSGLSWLRKAYERCKQQAQDEDRSLEEVAAERWGSLKKLENLIAEAEENQRGGCERRMERRDEKYSGSDKDRIRDKGIQSRDRERDQRRERSRERDRGRDRSTERDRRREKSAERDRGWEKSREKDRRRERSRERDRGRERSREREMGARDQVSNRKHFQRPGSDNEEDFGASRSRFKRPSDDSAVSGKKNGFMRPPDTGDENRATIRNEGSAKRFMKPGDSVAERSHNRDERQSKSYSSDTTPRWKKKSEETVDNRKDVGDKKPGKEKGDSKSRGDNKKKSGRKSRSSSSESSSSGSDDTSADSDSEGDDKPPAPPPAKVLTEEELNDLAAKILRAEIMGDDDLAADLKSQLENARKVRDSVKAESGTTVPDFSHRSMKEGMKAKGRKRGKNTEEEEDNTVVLSRTSKGGLVRPVLGSSDDWGPDSGKRRKKNITTHDVKGERTMYFDDDDKFDLKTLVEQERAGTAEDQNSMFARLAGRSSDRDLDVDDMFVSKAAKKQNEAKAATKDRAAAIFEHRKINAAMEKCHRCFDKIPKHLIIAIGTKSYLCLPHHRSLSEGHCLIVPMQHVSAATSMDEDVWQEMQLFRKSLVQMFAADDQDVVVMETVMHLKHFPHTAIECVPLDRELGDLAPIYFKKAIQEAGPEWSDNKKLHSLSNKDVRHVIPKGFPYFSVDFGLQGGYATVIEDEASFPAYFGREIVGGMLDAEPTLWRKPHKQSFEDQRQKVLQFEQKWKPYDWTQNLAAGD